MLADVYPRRSADASFELFETEDEVLVLHLVTGRYYTLNETAAAFWMLCDGRRSGADVVEELLRMYDADEDTLTQTMLELWQELAEEGLLSDPPSA